MWGLVWMGCGLVEALRYEPTKWVADDFVYTTDTAAEDEEASADMATDTGADGGDDPNRGIEALWYPDDDEDRAARREGYVRADERPQGYLMSSESIGWDCDDTDPAVHPEAEEICDDGIDNDCDGSDQSPTTHYLDRDGDGYGTAEETTTSCGDAPEGYVGTGDDCDDGDLEVHPAAEDVVCNGTDEDCDGTDATRTWHADADGDSYPSRKDTTEACEQPEGYLAGGRMDCDDANAAVNPSADEICGNGVDDDCDGDEDVGTAWWPDGDGDGWTTANPSYHCEPPDTGWAAAATTTDCDDTDPEVHPGATEACGSGRDEDCDGVEDTGEPWSIDEDGDGYSGQVAWSCDAPEGAVDTGGETDCDDGDATVNPAAEETCGNGADDDCSGDAPECGVVGELASSQADAWLAGEGAADRAGAAVASPGDVDGDGVPDLLVGAYEEDTMGAAAGASYLVLGPLTADRDLSDYDALLLGMGPGDAAGSSMTAADLDGDGHGDLVVGAAYAGKDDAGSAYVAYGPLTGQLLLDDADTVLRGEEALGHLGAALAPAGDHDGDGLDELLVGARGGESGAWTEGRALLFSLQDGELAPGDALATLTGTSWNDQAGFAVDGGLDVDGDGFPELVVGAPGDGSGAAFLVRGPVSGELALADADLTVTSTSTSADVGHCVALLEDQDGDGLAELAIGAPAAGVLALGGDLGDGSFDLSDLSVQLSGAVATDYFGRKVGEVGDLDGDGTADLVVSSSYRGDSVGGAWVFSGPLTASASSDEAVAIVEGGASGDDLEAVAGPGDLDEDGYDDLLLGVPGASGAALFLGGPGW